MAAITYDGASIEVSIDVTLLSSRCGSKDGLWAVPSGARSIPSVITNAEVSPLCETMISSSRSSIRVNLWLVPSNPLRRASWRRLGDSGSLPAVSRSAYPATI